MKMFFKKKNYLIPPQRSVVDNAYRQEIEKAKTISEIERHKGVVYGAQSMNRGVSGFIRRPTSDWDIMISNPALHARHLERALDRRFGGDIYKVKPAMHKGTFKVCEKRDNGRCIADFSSPSGFPDLSTTTRDGMKTTTLKFEEGRRRAILRDKKYKFRWQKAEDDLAAIRYQQAINKFLW